MLSIPIDVKSQVSERPTRPRTKSEVAKAPEEPGVLEYLSRFPGDESCETCAGHPFLSTAEFAISMAQSPASSLQRGIRFESGINRSAEGLGREHRLLYTMSVPKTPIATARALVAPLSFGTIGVPHAERQAFHRANNKVAFMHIYASGLSELHSQGYLHSQISLDSLMITRAEPPSGYLGGLGAASAFSANRRVYTAFSRGSVLFTAPEVFIEHPSDVALPGCDLMDAERPIYELTPAADVWALGVAFLMILTETNVFTFRREQPFVSTRGLTRLAALAATGASEVDIESALITECVRWQSYKLFGISTTEGSVGEVENGNIRRKMSLRTILNDAVNRGILSLAAADVFSDLLYGMLNPIASERMTAEKVKLHPAFQVVGEWAARSAASGMSMIPASHSQFAPRGGWTKAKDRAVAKAVRSAILDANSTAHLPVEAAFVAFDVAARAVAGISAPEPEVLLNAVAISAVRVACLLYDNSASMSARGAAFVGENSDTMALEPYVVEYLHGGLRRENYIYAMVSDLSDAAVVDVFRMMIDGGLRAEEFRSAYLTMDTVMWMRGYTVSEGVPSETRPLTTVHTLRKAISNAESRVSAG